MVDPTHGDIMSEIESLKEITLGNKARLDEMAGASRAGKWMFAALLGVGTLGVGLWAVIKQ